PGVVSLAVRAVVLLLSTRAHLAEIEAAAHDSAIASKAAIDRAYALILSEPQVLVAWGVATNAPEIIGDPTLVTSADGAERVLAFDSWLELGAAHDMERSVDALRARGVGFAMTVTSLAGRIIEAKGQVPGGRAILRLRELSGIKHQLAELARCHQKHLDESTALRALID